MELNENMLILGKFNTDIKLFGERKYRVREWWYFDENGILQHNTFGMADYVGMTKSVSIRNEIRKVDKEIRIIKGDISEKVRNRIFCNWTDEEYSYVKDHVDGVWVYKRAMYNNVCSIDGMIECVDKNKSVILANMYSRDGTIRANIETVDELIHTAYHDINFISDSGRDDTFDAIVVSFPLIQGKNTKQEMSDIIKANIPSVKHKVVKALNKDRSYKKYGVPVNFLKITKINITRDNMLDISLELKKV